MVRKILANNLTPLTVALLLALGAWLMGMFGQGMLIRSGVAGRSDLSWYLGLVILVGAFGVLVSRQWVLNNQPMGQEERGRWGEVRGRGRWRYLYEGASERVWGFLVAYLVLLIFGSLLWSWREILFRLGFFAVIHLCVSFVEPIRHWELNERAYKTSEPRPRPNNGMHPTADTSALK